MVQLICSGQVGDFVRYGFMCAFTHAGVNYGRVLYSLWSPFSFILLPKMNVCVYTIKCFKQFHHSIPYYAINLIQQPGSNKNKGKKKANDKTHFSHLRFSSLCPFVCWTPPTEVYFPSNHLCSWWFVVKIIINRLVLVLMIY